MATWQSSRGATVGETVAGYTMYGIGGSRVRACCCCNVEPKFELGLPSVACGATTGTYKFKPHARFSKVQGQFEAGLKEAAQMADESISCFSHFVCAACDETAGAAAARLNNEFCPKWNKQLRGIGLFCFAQSEVHGFGRSQATYLVMRVNPAPDAVITDESWCSADAQGYTETTVATATN